MAAENSEWSNGIKIRRCSTRCYRDMWAGRPDRRHPPPATAGANSRGQQPRPTAEAPAPAAEAAAVEAAVEAAAAAEEQLVFNALRLGLVPKDGLRARSLSDLNLAAATFKLLSRFRLSSFLHPPFSVLLQRRSLPSCLPPPSPPTDGIPFYSGRRPCASLPFSFHLSFWLAFPLYVFPNQIQSPDRAIFKFRTHSSFISCSFCCCFILNGNPVGYPSCRYQQLTFLSPTQTLITGLWLRFVYLR